MPTHSSDRWLRKEKTVIQKMIQAIDAAVPAPKRRKAPRQAADTIPPVDPTGTPSGAIYMARQGSCWNDCKNAAYEQSLRDAGAKMRARHAR